MIWSTSSECPVLEPALLTLIGRLRQFGPQLLAPGGSAEAALTRTDSGVDLLIEAAEHPELGTCEALARFAEESDLARIVWRAGADEILLVERRPVRMVFSGVAVPFPPGLFCKPAPWPRRSSSTRPSRRSAPRARFSTCLPGSALSPLPWPMAGRAAAQVPAIRLRYAGTADPTLERIDQRHASP